MRRINAGLCWDKPSGAAFSNSLTSELARDYEITSPTRSPNGPAFSRLTRDQEFAKNWHPEKAPGTPGLPGWRVF